MVEIAQVVAIRHVSSVVKATTEATVLHMAKSAKSAEEIIISNQFVVVVMVMINANVTLVTQDQGKAIKGKDFMR